VGCIKVLIAEEFFNANATNVYGITPIMIAEQRRSHVLEAFEKSNLKIKGYKVKDDVVEEKFE